MLFEPQAMERKDPKGILKALRDFPEQFRSAMAIDVDVPELPRDVQNIVSCGMGASAISSRYIESLIRKHATLPYHSVLDYNLPRFVNGNTLVVCVSYSGNTEETVSCFQEAVEKGAMVAAITSGGKLAELARKHGAPLITIPGGIQPRSAFAYVLVPQLRLLVHWGLTGTFTGRTSFPEAQEMLDRYAKALSPESPLEENVAKRLALALHGKRVTVIGARDTGVVARRVRCQLNENAKVFARDEYLPECHHNDIVPWSHIEDPQRWAVLLIESPVETTPQYKRMRLHKDLMATLGVTVQEIVAEGDAPLARMMTATYVGDYASLYLAMLAGKDPGDVAIIEELKRRLAEMNAQGGNGRS